jgi:uncharacterized protein YndB with AHSA1/START domain
MTAPTDRDIRIVRVYDAPLALVWAAWTEADRLAQWWGPRGFTITTHARDLRPGGSWRYTMHGPDGKDWPNFTRYHVVEPLARLEYDHGATAEDAAPMFRVVARFTDLGGRTELEMTMTLPTPEAARETRAFVRAAGGNGTWDRLAEHLEQSTTGAEVFHIARSFDAPIETVFDAWATPEQLARWLAPTGFTMAFQHADIRAGGRSAYSMTNGQFTMYGRAEYLAVERPHRLEYTQVFTDAEGKVSRHPAAPTWPEKMRTRVLFTAEGPSQTRVAIRWSVEGAATPEEMATFMQGRAGMTQGWTGSFDKLEAFLAGGTTAAAAG